MAMGNQGMTPPDGYTSRAATWDDLEAVIELFRQVELDTWGEADVTEQEMRHEWEDRKFDLTVDSLLVLGTEGGTTPAAYGSLIRWGQEHLIVSGSVHPSHRGRGIGSFLLDAMEARADEVVSTRSPDQILAIRSGVNGPDTAGRRLLEARGYQVVRHFWRMDRTLAASEDGPAEIPGIVVRPFVYGQDDRAFHAAL